MECNYLLMVLCGLIFWRMLSQAGQQIRHRMILDVLISVDGSQIVYNNRFIVHQITYKGNLELEV